MPPGASVQEDDDRADARVGQGEGGGLAVEGVRNHRGEHRDPEHAGDHQDPVQGIVGVEAVGVERVADPGPPHRDEQPREDEEAVDARIRGEPVRQLRDCDDEDEVEEELEPGRVPLVPVVLSVRSRGRVVPPRGHRHAKGERGQRPRNSGLRFSVNAVRPSRASSDANAR